MKNGWQTKTIGDVCEFQRGLTYAKGDEVDVSDNVVLRATNIDLATNLLIFDELKYINAKVIVPESKKVKKGSLMICTASGSKSHLGKVALIDEDYGYAFGGFMGMLTPQNGLLPKYLFHLMTTEDYKDFIGALSDGANINNLTFDNLKRFPVPFPPLDEQKRIVAKLDEAFVGLAKAKENSEKNLQNARALFESHLESVFTQRGKGWVEKPLGDICKTGSGGTPLSTRKEYYDGGDIPWLVSGEVAQGNVRTSKNFITKAGLENSSAKLFPKDTVLVAMYGATAGQVGILRFEAATNQAVCGILPNDKFVTEFLFYFFLAEKDKLVAQATGNAQPNISQIKIKNTVVPVPPLAEQQRIVDLLDSLHEQTQRLARLYEQKLEVLDSLKKSILHEAFSGNL